MVLLPSNWTDLSGQRIKLIGERHHQLPRKMVLVSVPVFLVLGLSNLFLDSGDIIKDNGYTKGLPIVLKMSI